MVELDQRQNFCQLGQVRPDLQLNHLLKVIEATDIRVTSQIKASIQVINSKKQKK